MELKHSRRLALAQVLPEELMVLALQLLVPPEELEPLLLEVRLRVPAQVPKPSHLCGFRVLRPVPKEPHWLQEQPGLKRRRQRLR
jgi:hypothetical protein